MRMYTKNLAVKLRNKTRDITHPFVSVTPVRNVRNILR